MNTTLVFAELLITGLHTGIWLFLLALNIFGTHWLQNLPATTSTEWKTVILIVLLAIFYILGIIVDRVADFVFFAWDKKLRGKILPDVTLRSSVMRFNLVKDNDNLNHQFEYTRSRMRVVRASALNFAISTILLLALILTQVPNSPEKIKYILFVVIIGILLTVGSVFAWYKLTQSHFTLLKRNWDFQTLEQNKTAKTTQQRKGTSQRR